MLDLLIIAAFVFLLIASAASWINIKILIEEVESIKKHLGVGGNESGSIHKKDFDLKK